MMNYFKRELYNSWLKLTNNTDNEMSRKEFIKVIKSIMKDYNF